MTELSVFPTRCQGPTQGWAVGTSARCGQKAGVSPGETSKRSTGPQFCCDRAALAILWNISHQTRLAGTESSGGLGSKGHGLPLSVGNTQAASTWCILSPVLGLTLCLCSREFSPMRAPISSAGSQTQPLGLQRVPASRGQIPSPTQWYHRFLS